MYAKNVELWGGVGGMGMVLGDMVTHGQLTLQTLTTHGA